MKIKLLTILLTFLVMSCGSKTAKTVSERPKVEAENDRDFDPTHANMEDEDSSAPAMTGCVTFNDLTAGERDQAETAYVLYKEQLKEGNYNVALPYWKEAFELAPAANGRVKYQFSDGVKIYTHLYRNTSDPEKKDEYVAIVMSLYDKRAECFGDPSYADARKAFDYYYNFKGHASDLEIYNLLKQAIDKKGNEVAKFVYNPFTKLIVSLHENVDIPTSEAQKYSRIVLNDVEDRQEACKSNCDSWETIQEFTTTQLEVLEGIDNFYDCEYYVSRYYAEYESSPDDCEIIDKVYRRMLRGKCLQNDPRFIAIKNAKDSKCYTPPPPAGPLKSAFNAYNEGNYNEAVKLFNDFVQLTDDVEKKAKYTLIVAKVYYGDIKNFSKSRSYALKAAGYKSNWGEPYILIGKLYASSGPLCGPGRGWESQIVTWPAIDKFEYAKKIDPSVGSEANKWIATYKQYMPSKENIFSRLLKAGDSFKVGCWIQESTKIRTAD